METLTTVYSRRKDFNCSTSNIVSLSISHLILLNPRFSTWKIRLDQAIWFNFGLEIPFDTDEVMDPSPKTSYIWHFARYFRGLRFLEAICGKIPGLHVKMWCSLGTHNKPFLFYFFIMIHNFHYYEISFFTSPLNNCCTVIWKK